MSLLINGTSYSWSQIKLNILGQNPQGFTAIKYNDELEIEDNYGGGQFPVSRGYGNYKAEGSITLHMSDIESLIQSAPDGMLQKIPPFDIVVSFLPEDGVIVNHTLIACSFMNNGRDMQQNSKLFTTELNLKIAKIKWK